jgi:hypothetical protein
VTLDHWNAHRLLPAWFVSRMMGDCWSFALLTTTGQVILIDTIEAIHEAKDGGIWLDVILSQPGSFWHERLKEMKLQIITAPTDRPTASINASHIVAAFEIADT